MFEGKELQQTGRCLCFAEEAPGSFAVAEYFGFGLSNFEQANWQEQDSSGRKFCDSRFYKENPKLRGSEDHMSFEHYLKMPGAKIRQT